MQNAIAVGAFVPREFFGAVFSVHDHAINIKDDNDYRLVSIVDREMDLTGLSVLVSRLPGGVGRGEAVTISDDHLSVLPTADGFGAAVSLRISRDLHLFSGSINDVSPVIVCEQLPVIRETVLAHGSPDGLRDLAGAIATRGGHTTSAPPHVMSGFARRAFHVIDAIDDDGPSIDLSGLVGLGIGFTPSGDDFICGALAAIDALRAGTLQPELDIGRIVDRLSTTTLAGATLLALACAKSFPTYLVRFVRHLTESRTSDIEEAVRRAVDHGATSGTDALVGFLWMAERIC